MKKLRRKMSEVAIEQCMTELKAACRRPIDPPALETLIACIRPNFERVLDERGGRDRWTDHGNQMRNNGRYIGTLADFFGYHSNVPVVGVDQLMPAFQLVSAVCRVGAEEQPLVPADFSKMSPAEAFLRTVLPPPRFDTPPAA